MKNTIVIFDIIVMLILCGCTNNSDAGYIKSDINAVVVETDRNDGIVSALDIEKNSQKIDLDFYYTGDPGFPEESLPNRIIIGSAGCCFRARDIVLYMIDENGNTTSLLSEELIQNHDTYECISIPEINTPVEVFIDFTEEYADVKRISLKVANYSNTDEMLRTGLLLCFEDGTLTVLSGKEKTIYKAGIFFGDEKGYWYQSADTTASQRYIS